MDGAGNFPRAWMSEALWTKSVIVILFMHLSNSLAEIFPVTLCVQVTTGATKHAHVLAPLRPRDLTRLAGSPTTAAALRARQRHHWVV